jgi:SAM-dependent methyltransferase
MPERRMPEMSVLEFFDRVYRQYARYWQRDNCDSTDPADFPPAWAKLLRAIRRMQPGRALDLGAGEGSDAIRLARLGFDVDAVEGSAAGAEKIEAFARQARVHVNVIHEDARVFQPATLYDVIVCNGLLHYLAEKAAVLQKLQDATRAGGYNLVFLFSDFTPVPECHRIIDVFCDSEDGVVVSSYKNWQTEVFLDRDRPETSHPGFPPHRHSLIKIVTRKPML